MAYLEGLLYRPEGQSTTEETRAGAPRYAGQAWNLEEWKFRVLQKKKAIETMTDTDKIPEKIADLVSRVTDGLSDDALKIAMDLGDDALSKPDGLDQLVKEIEGAAMLIKYQRGRSQRTVSRRN